jgi:hypothetical protein
MNLFCDNCQEPVSSGSALLERDHAHCPECGSVLEPDTEIHDKLERLKDKKISEMDLLELAAFSSMPANVHQEIERQADLALLYLEDGAVHTAAAILRRFLSM